MATGNRDEAEAEGWSSMPHLLQESEETSMQISSWVSSSSSLFLVRMNKSNWVQTLALTRAQKSLSIVFVISIIMGLCIQAVVVVGL